MRYILFTFISVLLYIHSTRAQELKFTSGISAYGGLGYKLKNIHGKNFLLSADTYEDYFDYGAHPMVDVGATFQMENRFSFLVAAGYSQSETAKDLIVKTDHQGFGLYDYWYDYSALQFNALVRYHYLIDRSEWDLYSGFGISLATMSYEERVETVGRDTEYVQFLFKKEDEYMLPHVTLFGANYQWSDRWGGFAEIGTGALGIVRMGINFTAFDFSANHPYKIKYKN